MRHDAQDAASALPPSAEPATISPSQRLAILRAISDPRRMEILERLCSRESCLGCSDLRELLPISAATLSHHIKKLEAAGLIEVRREGKFHYLSLRPGVLSSLAAGLTALEPASCPGR